jgi:hypothetical protein
MRKTLAAGALAVLAAAYATQQPADLSARVTDLEKRVGILERAQPIHVDPAQWTGERITWLYIACEDLQRGKATIHELEKLCGKGPNEQFDALSDAIGRAGPKAMDAKMQSLANYPLHAAELATEALALYNAVAKAVGEPERTPDSPKVELVHVTKPMRPWGGR